MKVKEVNRKISVLKSCKDIMWDNEQEAEIQPLIDAEIHRLANLEVFEPVEKEEYQRGTAVYIPVLHVLYDEYAATCREQKKVTVSYEEWLRNLGGVEA